MNLTKLLMTDYKVEMMNDGMQDFFVQFHKPKHSPYQEGVWKIRVELPDAYPYKSPSIGFVNYIYHLNVDAMEFKEGEMIRSIEIQQQHMLVPSLPHSIIDNFQASTLIL